VLVDTLLVGLLDCDHGIAGKVREFSQDFLGHFTDTVFNKPGILVRGEHYCAFISALQELIDPAAHRVLEDPDHLLEVYMLVVIGLDTEESLAPLVVGGHGDRIEELVYLVLGDVEILQDPVGAFLHDVLSTGAGCHTGDFRTYALADYWCAKRAPGYCPGMYLDDLMTRCMADRGLALDHELAAHQHFGTVCIFVPIEKLSCNNAAEFLDLVDFPVNCLLEHLVDHFKIPREVSAFEAAGQVNVNVEYRYKYYRSLSAAVHFDKFFDVLYADPSEVDPDIGRCGLDIR